MAIDFPSSPTVGQQYAYNNVIYTYTSQGMWVATGVGAGFAAGTQMLFRQAAAPGGWVKNTAYDDKALRIVSGAGGGSGGTVAFSTALVGRTATDDFTLTVATTAPHLHNFAANASGTYASGYLVEASSVYGVPASLVSATVNAGGGGAHAHGIDLRVQYVDSIICTKS